METILPNQFQNDCASGCHCHEGHSHAGHGHADGSGGNGKANSQEQELDRALASKSSPTRAVYRIANMDCPMEEALIRKKLATVPGVRGLEFNLMRRVLTVDHAPGSLDSIVEALKSIDMPPEPLEAPLREAKIPWFRLVFAAVLGAMSEMCEIFQGYNVFGLSTIQIAGFSLYEILALFLALSAIFLAGMATFRKGWLALSNFNLNMNALMSVAVTGAFLIGQFPEAAMVMVLFCISEAIEARALDHARNAIKDLLALAPEMAEIQLPDGAWVERKSSEIPVGALARVRPGQKIALDGIVASGHSEVNQAPITGESMPVSKKAGDFVFAGSINEDGSLEYRVTATADNSTLARIIHTVEDAQASKAPIQRFVDVFAKYYTPCVFLLAILWALVPPLFFDAAWLKSIYTALIILVIGCPCALVISTPVTVVSGMASATRKGILIKGGLYLEQGRLLNWLALDKTGTLTRGEPKLVDKYILPSSQDAWPIAVSLASRSDHPVSRAIAREGQKSGMSLLPVEEFTAIPGTGITGIVNGQKFTLGACARMGASEPGIAKRMVELEDQGKTVVALVGSKGAEAIFAVADEPRKTSLQAVKELAALGVQTVMLTGDNEKTAAAIAKESGVSSYRAALLPEQKLQIIEQREKTGGVVGMVGDGINDAPALAKADIGFAMAKAGTDTAIETADVALMDDDLRKIPAFIRLSRATHAILIENITLALFIKAVFFALTLSGHATMWMAVFADVGAALIVVANGLRAMRK